MAYQINPKASGFVKQFRGLFLIAGLVALVLLAINRGWINGHRFNKVEVTKLDNIQGTFEKAKYNGVKKIPLPSGDELVGREFAHIFTYDWHANSAAPLANGGAKTLDDSLIGKEGLVVQIEHQDDTNKSIKQFEASAQKFHDSHETKGGNVAFTIMGNAGVPLIEPMQAALKAIDPSYAAIGIDLWGKSDGEDQGIGPAEWLANPELMRGKIITCVYDDGDCQIVIEHLQSVSIPINLNYHTYNPNALNIDAVDDFTIAGKKFIAGTMVDPRPIVDDDGRPTGKTTDRMPIDAVASWTPVDRNIEQQLAQTDPGKYHSLATFTSTGKGEQRLVMPCVLVVLNKYYEKNLKEFTKLSYAIHTAAVQMDAFPDAKQRAMEYDTQIMGQWDSDDSPKEAAAKRLAAFNGYPAKGNRNLHIGGSAVFSFKDAANMLGMDGSGAIDLKQSTYASVYRTFGDLTVQKYPEKNLKTFTPFEKFFDARALNAAYQRAQSEGQEDVALITKREYTPETTGQVIGSASWKMTFANGSVVFNKKALEDLQVIQDHYAASEYPITVVGHTDRVGNDETNQDLSVRRANAVRDYLISKNKTAFGGNRITTDGKGSSEPPKTVDQNYKGACDECRRVEIVISK